MSARDRAAAAAVAAALLLGAPAAHADLTYELAPMLAVGATDNASVSTTPDPDGFLIAVLRASAQYEGRRTKHLLAYRVALTHFITGQATDSFTNELQEVSDFNLGPTLDLHFDGRATLTSNSRVDPVNPATMMPQQAVSGASRYLSLNLLQQLIYQPTLRWRFVQSLGLGRVNYVGVDLPSSTSLLAGLRGERIYALDTFSLDLQFTDFYTAGGPIGTTTQNFDDGQRFFIRVLAGWRRTLSAFWSAGLEAGPAFMFKADGPLVVAPAGLALMEYRQLTWFATLTATQTPTPNLLSGAASINDQVLVRLTLPLTKQETVALAGFGGYVYARTADDQGDLFRLYDQWTVGALCSARLGRWPFFGSLEYTFIDQHGSMTAGQTTPDLVRHTIVLSVSSLLRWGAGTPPIFPGL